MNCPELPKSNFEVESVGPNLEVPEQSEDSEEIVECDVCFKILGSKDSLEYHKRIHKKVHKCNVCDEKFNSRQEMKDHKILHGERPFECKTCHKTFKNKSNFGVHQRYVNCKITWYECEFCDQKFTKSFNLNKHRSIHTGGKRYECETCHGTFITNQNLIEHRRIHTGEKPFGCDFCDKKFRHKSSVYKHMKRCPKSLNVTVTP